MPVYFSGKDLTHDWVSGHLPLWEELLKGKVDRSVDVLEIGSFEGRSALFFLQYLPGSRITCVDTFTGSGEHVEEGAHYLVEPQKIERRFDLNMAPFGDRVTKRKQTSLEALRELVSQRCRFDVIYVDGDHRAAMVFFDASLAWCLLRPGGVLILDDYEWQPWRPADERPAAGIDAFLDSIAGEHELLHKGYQVVIAKSGRSTGRTVLTIDGAVRHDADRLASRGGGTVLTIDGAVRPQLKPPLVSFVLVNWNYGRFVGETIDSVIAQDYPHWECVVLDNGSTDDSREVIARHVGDDPRFRVIHLPGNLGQLRAATMGMDEARGVFVSFIDSDDVLTPGFASAHVQVHLAAPRSVAVTTSNIIEMDAVGTPLTSSYHVFGTQDPNWAKGLRDSSLVVRLPQIDDQAYADLHATTVSIPNSRNGWLWGPGTSNMLRMSVARMVRLNPERLAPSYSSDTHFLPICHAFAGTARINRPLSLYRIHGANDSKDRETLLGLSGVTAENMGKYTAQRYESIDGLLEGVRDFSWVLNGRFWSVIDGVIRTGMVELKDFYRSPTGVAMFKRYALSVREAFGDRDFVEAVYDRFGSRLSREIIAASYGGRMPLRGYRLLLKFIRRRRRERRRGAR